VPMPDDQSKPDYLEAVYYSAQVPTSDEALTLLAFVFDRIHFPGVYIPPPSVALDQGALQKEIDRIVALGRQDSEAVALVNCMVMARVIGHIGDLCVFTGNPSAESTVDPNAPELSLALEELIFGPRADGFIPMMRGNLIKALPGADERLAMVSFPHWSTYSANALLYSAKNQIPLVNDDPRLPIPGVPGDAKNNAKLLATILTIESVKLALPKLRPLTAAELRDFRGETSTYVKQFRLAMLRMAKDLNSAIASDMTLEEVQKQARFLVETTVYPELRELERIIHDPGKPWYRRAVDLAKDAPELMTNFAVLPKNVALAKLLARLVGVLADLRDEQRDAEHKLGRAGLHFLLKLRQL
jgi:hypothetical protein